MEDIERELVDRMFKSCNDMMWWRKVKDQYAPMMSKLLELGATASVTGTCVDLSITGDKDKLQKVFKILRQADYAPETRPEGKKSEYCSFFHYEGEEPGFKTLWLSFYSTVCKRVQVGVEMREFPVYDVQCEDLTVKESL